MASRIIFLVLLACPCNAERLNAQRKNAPEADSFAQVDGQAKVGNVPLQSLARLLAASEPSLAFQSPAAARVFARGPQSAVAGSRSAAPNMQETDYLPFFKPDTELSKEKPMYEVATRLNLKAEDVQTILERLPAVRDYSYEETIAPTLDKLQERLKLSEKDLQDIVTAFPAVLGLSYEQKIAPCLNQLQERLKPSEEDMQKILQYFPWVLAMNFERESAPTLDKLQQSLKLSQEDLKKLVVGCPAVLGLVSLSDLDDKLKFLAEELGANYAQLIVGTPNVLVRESTDLQKRIKEARHLGMKFDEAGMRRIVMWSQSKFDIWVESIEEEMERTGKDGSEFQDAYSFLQEQMEAAKDAPHSRQEDSLEFAHLAVQDALTGMMANGPSKAQLERAARQFEAFKEQVSADPEMQEQIHAMMARPEFQKQAASVKQQMEAVMADARLKEKAAMVHEQLEAKKSELFAFIEARQEQMQSALKQALGSMMSNGPSKFQWERAEKQFEAFKEEVSADPEMQKQIDEAMADPEFQQKALSVKEQLEAMMA